MSDRINRVAAAPAILVALLASLGACRVTHTARADSAAAPSDARAATSTPAAPVHSAATADTSLDAASATDSAADVNAAVAVVRHYYAAIDSHDYGSAYADWGENGPPGHVPLFAFKLGFSKTDSVALTVGTPGPIGAAAGSRYIEIPVTVSATQHDGEVQRYDGSYTLRRAVVDGASAAARRWHLYTAKLTRLK